MTGDWKKVGFFAAGLAIGAVATATLVLGPYSPAARNRMAARPAVAQAPQVVFRGAECPTEPAAIAAGGKDGRYRMPADLSGYSTTEPNVFVAMGKEAASAGRTHDAEIAYLMACRVADRFKGAGSVAAADARLELARYYDKLASTAPKDAPNCGEILRRAELMYSDSHQLYRAAYGDGHERSREAALGLSGVRQTLMAQAGITASPATVPPAAASPRPQAAVITPTPDNAAAPPAVPMARPHARSVQTDKLRERPPQRKVASRALQAPPACALARSRSEKLICSDAELARLDREVSHLQARARNAHRYEEEWRRREASCQDRACLLRVFSSRRSQLMADINSA